MEVIVNILAMTIPFSVALLLAYRGKGLLPVALTACGVVFVCERLLALVM